MVRRLIAKCILKTFQKDVKAEYDSTQICTGLEAGIEGAIRAVMKRAEENEETLKFGEWEVDNAIWEKEAGEGVLQNSLPMRRVQ